MQNDQMIQYTWVPFFEELSNALLKYRSHGKELIDKIEAVFNRAQLKNEKLKNNLSIKQLKKYDVDLDQVDPFTVMGVINRSLTDSNRIILCKAFKWVFNLKANVPTDFNGIPIFNNQLSWIIADNYDVWDIYEAALNYADKGTDKERFIKAFDEFKSRKTGIRYVTFGLFWSRPYTFISLDRRNEEYISALDTDIDTLIKSDYTGEQYLQICDLVNEKYKLLDDIHNNIELSMAAFGMGQSYIFQCNPSNYNMKEALKNLDKMTYLVNKNYVRKVSPYMNVYIWLSGAEGGVIAKARTISNVGTYRDPEGDKYYLTDQAGTYAENSVWIKFVKKLEYVIPKDVMRNHPILKDLNIFKFSQGTTFPITQEQESALEELINEKHFVADFEKTEKNADDPESQTNKDSYEESDFLDEVYMEPAEYHALVNLLNQKKNIILRGAPGVGKTFAAKRLAYSMIGAKDESKIKFIQFHQNYSYEDFVEGYRPKQDSDGFELVDGVFKEFCNLARGKQEKYFFIIDEINRGNLSRIFGELLMLIEADKRGDSGYTVNLAYSKEPFTVPENVYIIGMMNTADRSLAIIDYALRRRFSFFEMRPKLDALEKIVSEMNDPRAEKLIEAVKTLNVVIENDPSLGAGFQIGHSYFGNKEDDESVNDWLERVVNYDIIPTLEEYWFDNKQMFDEESAKLKKVIDAVDE